MKRSGADGARRVLGWLGKTLCVAILAMGFSMALFAATKDPAASLCQSPAKGLYYGGFGYSFINHKNPLGAPDLELSQIVWNNGWVRNWTKVLTTEAISGDLGACVYNGLLYVFFTTSSGALRYITVEPSTKAQTGPTTIVTGLPPNGAAAAVFGDAIYVLAAPGAGFVSKDGKLFATWSPHFNQAPPSQMIAAVTFYPIGDDPAGILFIYNDGSNPRNLRSCVVQPPDLTTVIGETILPWPSASPALWKPIVDGSLLLGTSAGLPGPGAKAGAIQFYGMTDYGSDGEHQGRWEYNLSDATWTFKDMTQTSVACYLYAFPWFDTIDATKGTMRMSHVVELYSGLVPGDQFFANRSDWMVPQNGKDPTYGWRGTPTATSNFAGTELQKLWTLVGVVLGPPPFPLNGVADPCGVNPLASVDYGKDTSTTVTTTSTSSSTISVASGSKIKAGLGEWSLDLSYAHAWTASHGTSSTVSVSQDFQLGPCSEQPGSQGTHGWAIFNAPTVVTQWYKLYAYDYDQSTGQGTYLNQDMYATSLGATVQQTAYFDLANPSQGEYPGLFAGMPAYPNSTDVKGWNAGLPNWDDGGSDWAAVFGDTTIPQMPGLTLGLRNEVSYTKSLTKMDSKGNRNSFDVKVGDRFSFLGFSENVTIGYAGEWTTETETESTITENVSCALNVPIPPYTPGYVNSMTVQPFWLQAHTAKAPWIPTGYSGNLPWCITWDVTQYGTVAGGSAGRALAPAWVSGTIHHGVTDGQDGYALSGGHMSWLDTDGTEMSMPLTAGQFDPSKGASVSLNGHLFSTNGPNGFWYRDGNTWEYFTTGVGGFSAGLANDWFLLTLDFANETWAFVALSRTLDQEVKGDASVRISLVLEGRYAFTSWLEHGADVTWSHQEEGSTSQPYGVEQAQGEYHSETGVGRISLAGHVPENVGAFGDVEIRVNGVPVDFPLLSTEGFLNAIKTGGLLTYQAEGLSFSINLGSGRWQAAMSGTRFKSGMAPKDGAIRAQVLVGGQSISDQTLVLQNWTAALRYPYHLGTPSH